MDEVTYTENYVDSVSGLEVVFQGRLERRLAKKRFDARTPQEFVLAWDAEVNGPPGFARLQARRRALLAAPLPRIPAAGALGPSGYAVGGQRGRRAGLAHQGPAHSD